MDIIVNLFRSLMFFFDNIIYGLISVVYKLFIYLSELNLYGDDGTTNPLKELVNHIYILLGIFMLFKVSFSLLQYIVDPNSFRDSSKGMGKLITNVLVALVLLVTVPYIFNVATELQKVIVQSNVIGELILGTTASDTVYTTEGDEVKLTARQAEVMARDLQFMVYGAFYSINSDFMTDGQIFSSCKGSSGVLGSVDMAVAENGACLTQLQDELPDDATSNGVTLYSFFKYAGEDDGCVDGVCDARDFEDFGSLLWWKVNGEYVINYLPFISSAAGLYIVFLLISFSVDIAVRAIKLCFLQMVAPIAIVSYIDPKESIGSGKLYNWIKECTSTYFSLFLRLATIFLVMLLVQIIASSILSDGGYISGQINTSDYSMWIYLFLVIGAFMFAKQVPNLIESIFGIKGSGDFNLNPFKNAGATALMGGIAGFGIGAAASGIAAAKTSLENGEGGLTAFRRTLGGAISGGLKGGISSTMAGGKGFMSKSFSAAGDVARNTAMKANTKARYRYGAYIRNAIGAQSLKENLDQRAAVFENYEKSVSNMEARARDQLSKKHDYMKLLQAQRSRTEQQYRDGLLTDAQYQHNLNYLFNEEESLVKQYIDNNGNMGTPQLGTDDTDLIIEKQNFARNVRENGLSSLSDLSSGVKSSVSGKAKTDRDALSITWDEFKDVKKESHNETLRIKNSDKYEDATNAEKAKLSDLRQSFLNK